MEGDGGLKNLRALLSSHIRDILKGVSPKYNKCDVGTLIVCIIV